MAAVRSSPDAAPGLLAFFLRSGVKLQGRANANTSVEEGCRSLPMIALHAPTSFRFKLKILKGVTVTKFESGNASLAGLIAELDWIGLGPSRGTDSGVDALTWFACQCTHVLRALMPEG